MRYQPIRRHAQATSRHPTDGRYTRSLLPARWTTRAFTMAVLGLALFGVATRLYRLGPVFDRNGYDEGAYWESLRAMKDGHGLYREVFLSQPPFFLLSTFPTYVVFGSSLWSARLGIAVTSLIGFVGALVLGRSLAGRAGGAAALGLIVVSPLYLAQSQTIEAEASSVAFSLLAVAAAYRWSDHSNEPQASWWAALCGAASSLAVLCKVSAVVCVVPVALVVAGGMWKDRSRHSIRTWSRPVLLCVGTAAAVSALVVLPYAGSDIFDTVYTFHIKARSVFKQTEAGNASLVRPMLTSLLTVAAAFGFVTALVRRDWRIVPLTAWLVATAYLLLHQVPLFSHHLVVLVPPLVALAVMGLDRPERRHTVRADDTTDSAGRSSQPRRHLRLSVGAPAVAATLIVVTASLHLRQDQRYFNAALTRPTLPAERRNARVAEDVRRAVQPGSRLVTDAPFIAGLADRHLPAALVDPSAVRIMTGYLVQGDLIAETSSPQVHAVLFFSGRFRLGPVAGFHEWVSRHFRLRRTYGPGQELWTR